MLLEGLQRELRIGIFRVFVANGYLTLGIVEQVFSYLVHFVDVLVVVTH